MAGRDLSAELFGSPAKPGAGRDLSAELFGEKPKDEGFFSNLGKLAYEGGERAIGAAKVSPSVISGNVGPDQAATISKQLSMEPSVQPKELTEVQGAFKDEAEALNKAKGFTESVGPVLQFMGEFGKQALTNPKGIAYLTAQSAANMAPSIAGMIAGGKGGAALGSLAGPVGTAAGAVTGSIAGGFAGSAPMEIGAEFMDNVGKELRERGMKPTEENVKSLLQDRSFVEKAVSESRTKGVTTAAVDAATTAGAGRFATGPSRAAMKTARAELGAAADAAKVASRADEILKQGTKAERAGRAIKRGAGAVGIDVAGGGASEAAGQYAAYGEIDPESVALEMLGELGSSAIEVPSAAYATGKDALKSKAKTDAAEILKKERAAQPEQPQDIASALKSAGMQETQPSDLDELERRTGMASVKEEPVVEPVKPAEPVAEEPVAPVATPALPAAPAVEPAAPAEPAAVTTKEPIAEPAATPVAATAEEPATKPAAKEPVEQTPYGLNEVFSDNAKDQTRINGLMKSGKPKVRFALGEANDTIQKLADTIRNAGYNMDSLVPGQVPPAILRIKSQIGVLAAGASRLANNAEAVEKGHKRADPKRIGTDAQELMNDIAAADELVAYDQNVPTATEQMEGAEVPPTPEVEDLMDKQRKANEDISTMSKRTAGTSLMKVLEGQLADGEISELGGKARKIGKNPFVSLVAKKGKPGASMENMVESGSLDLFLPDEMRPGAEGYDNAESAEYIRDKLRAGEYYTHEMRQEIDTVQRGVWDLEKEIDELLTIEDINKEIQYALEEQRRADQETAEPAAPEEAGAAAESPEQKAEELITSQTEEELKRKEAEIERLSKENERLAKEVERKAKADEEAGDFVLTGSDRPADKAAARGQMELTEDENAPGDNTETLLASDKAQTGYSIDPEEQRVEKELTGKTMVQAADWTVKNAPNAFMRVIAEKVRNRLRELERRGVEFDFKVEGGNMRSRDMSGSRGVTSFTWGDDQTKISVRLNGAAALDNQNGYPPGTRYETVLHELLHVATRAQFKFLSPSDGLGKQLVELTDAIVKRYNADAKAGKLPPIMERYYKRMNNALEDPDEVLAWGLTNKEVQDYFADIKVGDKSVMTRLVELMRQVLGLGKPYESALDRLVTLSESMLDTNIGEIESIMGARGKKLGKARAPVQESLFQKEGAPAESRDIRNQRERQNVLGEPVLGNWTLQPDTKLDTKDSFIYKLLDKNIDIKRVIQAITKEAGEIAARWNPYLQEELYHGRTAKETQDFMTKEMKPLLQEMSKDGITIGEFEEYLQNRHAEEYNTQVAKVNKNNPDMQDGGSGIKTADARKYLANLPDDQRAKYESLAKKIDAITKGTRELLVKSGMEKRETIDAWERAFPSYVPLQREQDDFEYTISSTGTGRGFDVRGAFSRRAMGSNKKVIDVIANIALSRERAIVKANKNRVAQAVYGLAVQNANPSFWMAVNPLAEKMPEAAIEELQAMGLDESAIEFLMKEPRQRAVDPKNNEVVNRINTMLRNSDYVLSMRLNGENRYVFFNPNDERATRAVTALKNLDAEQLGAVMGTVAKVTRWMASVNTQYNPIFGAYNFLRDVQGAALQLSDTPLAGKQGAVLKSTIPAMRAIYASMRGERKGKDVDTEMAKLWTDFQKAGGQTGFRDMYSRSQDRAEALQKELTMISEGKLKSLGRGMFNLLSDYNDTMENAVRLAAYKTALESGIGKEEAASIAKNLTVNFNKKGQIATQAGALYAFFNAAMQGTARLHKTLTGPAGKKIMAGGLLWGAIQASLLAFAGFDDEEPPEFVRERNFIFPIGGKKYIAFPMPLGYHVIPGTSRIITEWALSGFKDTPERIASLTGMYLDAFNPIGNAGWSVQTIAPTFADPIVALAENRDWTGKTIAKKDFNALDPTPGYLRAKDAASWFSTQLAKFMNYASGGTKYQPGILSPTPDQIDYLIGQATGGLGRELLKASTSIEKTYTGEELPAYKIPVVGRFYGEATGSASEASRFYKNLEHLNKLENEIKGRRENHEPLGDFLAKNPESRLAKRAHEIQSDIKKLRERKEKLIERDAPRESIKVVEEQMTRKMKMLNDRVAEFKK